MGLNSVLKQNRWLKMFGFKFGPRIQNWFRFRSSEDSDNSTLNYISFYSGARSHTSDRWCYISTDVNGKWVEAQWACPDSVQSDVHHGK